MSVLARFIRFALVVAVSGGVAGGCAHQAGKQAAAGALAGLGQQSEQMKAETGQYVAQMIGSRAVQGGIEAMTSPREVERLEELTNQLVAAAVERALDAAITPTEQAGGRSPIEVAAAQVARSFEHELAGTIAVDLGPSGPLGRTLVGTSAEMSGSAARGIVRALFPECGTDEPRCVDRRLAELAQESAAGAARGLARSVGWLLAAGSFAAGVIATLLLVVTLRLFRRGGGTEAGAPRRTAEHHA